MEDIDAQNSEDGRGEGVGNAGGSLRLVGRARATTDNGNCISLCGVPEYHGRRPHPSRPAGGGALEGVRKVK